MAMNTTFVGSDLTTRFTSNVSVDGRLTSGSTTALAATTMTTLTVTSGSTFSGQVNVGGGSGVSMIVGSAGSNAPVDRLNLTGVRTLSRLTTASVTSLIIGDGEFMVGFHSGNSCRLCFRSGATTYTIIATTGGVL